MRAKATAEPDGEVAAAPLTVCELAQRLDKAVRDATPRAVRVVGEVSNFRDRTHLYFDLKDENAVVNCVMFAGAARRCGFRPSVGDRVVACGRCEFYAKGGKVSFVLESIEPAGAGDLDAQLKRLVAEARALGWLDAERKRPLPAFCRKVAVVTSRTGAALQDVLVTMRRRCPAVGVVLIDARVQGDGAAVEVARAVRTASRRARSLGVDAVLVTRGGGSTEDLWCFNDKELARAIVECSVPVVAAVGHETDTTLAELVADVRCATPTQAAVALTPDPSAIEHQLTSAHRRLLMALSAIVHESRQRVRLAERSGVFSDPRAYLRERAGDVRRGASLLADALRRTTAEAREQITESRLAMERARPDQTVRRARLRVRAVADRLHAAAKCRADAAAARTKAARELLAAVAPERVLARGYSMTRLQDGTVVRDAAQAPAGTALQTTLARGVVRSIAGESSPRPARGPVKRAAVSQDVPGLFGGSTVDA